MNINLKWIFHLHAFRHGHRAIEVSSPSSFYAHCFRSFIRLTAWYDSLLSVRFFCLVLLILLVFFCGCCHLRLRCLVLSIRTFQRCRGLFATIEKLTVSFAAAFLKKIFMVTMTTTTRINIWTWCYINWSTHTHHITKWQNSLHDRRALDINKYV